MKILPTIGPISQAIVDLKAILRVCNIIRINGSHSNIKWHENISKKIKRIRESAKILLDIPGVKPRTKNTINIEIKKGQEVLFAFKGYNRSRFKKLVVQCSNRIPKLVGKVKYLSLDDGKYSFSIIKINKKYILTKSNVSFVLSPGKGINIPLSRYDDNFQNIQYLKFLSRAKKVKYDAIGLSYVQNQKIILKIKKKFSTKLIISKIENSEGLKNCVDIIHASDAVMIDRGDLSAEVGDENLNSAILKITEIAKKNGKPLILATENLISMNSRSKPSKSEIMSLNYADHLGVDIIMLSDETAISKNWKKILVWLNKYLKKKIPHTNESKITTSKNNIFWNVIDKIPNIPIVIFSKKGFAVNRMVNLKENLKLIIFSDNDKTIASGTFRKNTICHKVERFNKNNFVAFINKTLKKFSSIVFKESDVAALIYIAYPEKNSRANTISILSKKEFL